MPVRKSSTDKSNGQGLKIAGIILRRNPEREFHTYLPLLAYHPSDYQILLRTWPTAPFKDYLAAFSGPVLKGKDPSPTLVQETYNWTRRLAQQVQLKEDTQGLSVRRAEFLSVHGGGGNGVDPVSGQRIDSGITLSYVLPTTTRDSSVVSRYPATSDYPQFYDLSAVLQGMTASDTLKLHPFTREMLSALDRWLRERHSLPGSINSLFSPSLESRLKMYITNPLHDLPTVANSNHNEDEEEENKTIGAADVFVAGKGVWPISSSTPFQPPADDSTLHETTAFSIAKLRDTFVDLDHKPADAIIKNPLFGSGLEYNQVEVMVMNRYYGHGVPDYDSLGEKRGEWSVQVEGDGMPDWIDLFPMHKCACEGDSEGVRRCVEMGVSPNERDTDSWTALHYACWYGELEVVKVLVGEASADLGVINNSDSTPLHLAAATGHSEVVAYLLQQPGIQSVQTAIDCEGKSPLAVCLECRQKEWSETAKLLREAYKKNQVTGHVPSVISSSSPTPQHHVEHGLKPIPFWNDDMESLGDRGSQRNMMETKTPHDTPKKNEKHVRRQRIDVANGRHYLAHFSDGKDTHTSQVLQDVYKVINLVPEYYNMLALWIQSDSLAIQLGDNDKPLQLMSTWPTLLSQHVAKSTVAEIPQLCLKRNVFISQMMERLVGDALILELLYSDARNHVLSGHYSCTEEDAIELGGLYMQLSYGDHVSMVHHSGFLREKLGQVLPIAMATSRRRVEFERRVLTQHSKITQEMSFLSDDNDMQVCLYKRYLQKCWQWPFYGAAFFPGTIATKLCRLPTEVKFGRKAHVPIVVAVNTTGFHLISMENNNLLLSLDYASIEWDSSSQKNCVVLKRSDKSLYIEIQTKMAGLIYSLVSKMIEQYPQNTGTTPVSIDATPTSQQ